MLANGSMRELIPGKLWIGDTFDARDVTGGVVRLPLRCFGVLLFFMATAGGLSADEQVNGSPAKRSELGFHEVNSTSAIPIASIKSAIAPSHAAAIRNAISTHPQVKRSLITRTIPKM